MTLEESEGRALSIQPNVVRRITLSSRAFYCQLLRGRAAWCRSDLLFRSNTPRRARKGQADMPRRFDAVRTSSMIAAAMGI